MSISTADNALLSQDSYKDHKLNELIKLGGIEYKILDHIDNPSTGYQATAYQRSDTGEVVIAHRGTEFDREPMHDGGVDAGMVLTGLNAQTSEAMAFTRKVMDEAKKDASEHHYPLNITVTGHSLGGTLAEITAYEYGLHGETFNAYGAAGLMQGIPHGGHQVIDHVRAGDVVSAASPHFGEVHIYAAQQDIDTLSEAGYRDDGGLLTPRNPMKAIDFGAHGIDNFVPDSKTLGHSIISPESEARYRAHHGMIDRYRSDVMDLRTGLSASWERPKLAVESGMALGHTAVHEVTQGVHAAEYAAQSLASDASKTFDTLRHPGSWFDDKPAPVAAPVRLDHAMHPDHPLYQQTRDAVHRLDAEHHRTSDQHSDNLAASLVVAARRDGLQAVHHVVLSNDATRAFAVQGELNSSFKQITQVETAPASNTSIEQSSAAWLHAMKKSSRVRLTRHGWRRSSGLNNHPNLRWACS